MAYEPVFDANGWATIDSAPRDGTECMFYSPGNSGAWNANATEPHMHIDRISAERPNAMRQYPEAPYTHWKPLGPGPVGT
jgi:hypothetical protein